jgi:cell wall-associated NlpC family hydrolase
MENYYAQAFKFLGTDYGWGGADGNVDCSGYICAVMRSFGIYLPRNTGDQSKLDVLLTKLSGTGDDNITSVITSTDTPTAIYRPGHVMLYLGVRDGVIYIIHAPTGGDKVKVAPLTYISNITGIRQFK